MAQLSRRDALVSMLGLPLAMTTGCGGSKSKKPTLPPLPPGELVGTSDSVGHRIRDGMKLAEPTKWETHDVIIVGAGIAGLSAARRLQESGVADCLILELESELGGTARSGRSKLVSYPWGAHYITAPTKENEPLVKLLTEMDVLDGADKFGDPIVKDAFVCRDPEERLFFNGKWHDGLYPIDGATAQDREQYFTFKGELAKWAKWRDKLGRRAFTMPMAKCSDDEELQALDKNSMGQWLDELGLDSPRLRWYVNYACRDDYGMTLDQTSAWAGIFYFASRIGGDGKSRPYITWPEGNGRLVAQLRQSTKAKIKTGLPVARIRQSEQTDGKVELFAFDKTGRQHGFRAKHVVFAAPHFLAPYVIEDYAKRSARYMGDFKYAVWAVVNMQLSRAPQSTGAPMSWDNVLYDSPALGYVSATHQKGIDGGKQHVTYYYPLLDDDPAKARGKLLQIDRDGWVDIALTDLARAHTDIRQIVERADVIRWGHAMIQPRVNFIWGTARREAAKPWPGVFFAHSDLSGLALFEEAFFRGTQAAEELLKAV